MKKNNIIVTNLKTFKNISEDLIVIGIRIVILKIYTFRNINNFSLKQ
jgi:hypothetical protein